MINYIYVLMAVILLAVEFAIYKNYQNAEGSDRVAGLKYNALVGAFTAVLFFFIGGCKFTVSLFSIALAAVMCVFSVSCVQAGLKILKKGNLALYTFFLLSGGMILPYVYGVIFLNEELNLFRMVGLIVFTVAILLAGDARLNIDKKDRLLCFAVFVMNGGISIISKTHQIDPWSMAVSSTEYVMLTGLCKAIFSMIMLLTSGRGNVKRLFNSKKVFILLAVSALISGLAYMLQLIGAVQLPATVLYPLVTGGSLIFTAIAGRIIFKEKITKKQAISIGLCLFGTLLFL